MSNYEKELNLIKPDSPNRLSRYTKQVKEKDVYDFDFLDDLEKELDGKINSGNNYEKK